MDKIHRRTDLGSVRVLPGTRDRGILNQDFLPCAGGRFGHYRHLSAVDSHFTLPDWCVHRLLLACAPEMCCQMPALEVDLRIWDLLVTGWFGAGGQPAQHTALGRLIVMV